MTEKERVENFRLLLDYPPFQILVAEVENEIRAIMYRVATDLESLCLVDKGVMMGMKEVITRPGYVVTQFDKQKEDSEPS